VAAGNGERVHGQRLYSLPAPDRAGGAHLQFGDGAATACGVTEQRGRDDVHLSQARSG
jgi:hypothetical protein